MQIRTALVLLAATAAPAAADHDGIRSMQKNAETGKWAECVSDYVSNVAASGAIDDDVTLVLGGAVGNLAAGSKQPIAAIAHQCAASAKSEARSESLWDGNVRAFLFTYLDDLQSPSDYPGMRARVAACNLIADGAIAGADPDAAIEANSRNMRRWTGKAAEVRALCDRGDKLVAKLKPQYLDTFVRAGLKNDKLARVEAAPPGASYVVWRKEHDVLVGDPEELARESVWFRNRFGMQCGGGGRHDHIVERLQFDRDGKLVNTTQTASVCGDAPASAYK